jgi:hypothetical protein
MQPIIKLTHAKIQRELRESKRSVDGILKSLGVDKNKKTTLQELYRLILNDLKNMQFVVKYDRYLCNAHEDQSVPAFTKFHTSNRSDGGIIMLNPDYSKKERFEAFIHEYIHIKDHSLPIYTDYTTGLENKAAFYKFYLELNEYQADIDGDSSTIPEQIKIDILVNADNIDKVLEKYQELYRYIIDDLKRMNFVIEYNKNINVPARTVFNTTNRINGGTIMLNPYYSRNEMLEALYYEYVHIIDYILPIYEMYEYSPEYKVMVDQYFQNLVEFQADVRTYTLLMPPEEIMESLLKNFYNIDVVLEQFKIMEKSSVLQWITIIDNLSCHFAWVMLQKDNDNNIVRRIAHDSCYYDKQNDPQEFKIQKVLETPDSAAALALKNRQAVQKNSIIDGKEYYCYTYYETDPAKIVRNEAIPGSVFINYDRLLVIGWERAVYDTIQHLSNYYKQK